MNTLTLLSDAKYFDEANSKFAELRTLLDSKHAKEKLEAMKRLMAMITIGRDVSSFFPDVVKNVVVESQEVKKLVYMYLIHYAEQNQELALLTINTFQKDLTSHSQRVRANAMKAMSSIKIPVAVPLVILALKAAAKDHSSYVRRAAAQAIPKVASVDPDQHELLVELITELLANNEPLVLGSAIFAFLAVCPDRHDLIHPHFRKICHLLADFDEWGQIITLDLLLRYGRCQFLNPHPACEVQAKEGEEEKQITASPSSSPAAITSSTALDNDPLSIFNTVSSSDGGSTKKKKKEAEKKKKKKGDSFYSDDDDDSRSSSSSDSNSSSSDSNSDSGSDSDGSKKKKKKKSKNPNPAALPASSTTSNTTDLFSMPQHTFSSSTLSTEDLDEDHRLLLKQACQLLQSSNTGVIVAVCSLMWSLAPAGEMGKIVRPLVRLSRNKRNIQYIVLLNIATMVTAFPSLFKPYFKDFFIFANDPRYIKEIKLDILTCIVTEESMGVMLKEFTIYTADADKEFVVRAIQAIGRCAIAIPAITQRCIRGLMALVVKNAHEGVVAQSVVTIRQLLQSNVGSIHASLLLALSKLLDQQIGLHQFQARSAIVWMVGEYRDRIAKLAPDVLRKLAKTFTQEHESVKMQILNLALKLFLSNPKQTSTLFKYIMDLCKYDSNIDLRDRARMMRSLFFKKKAAGDAAALKDAGSEVKDHFKTILLTEKPSPKVVLPFAGRDKWILGSLSHTMNLQVQGYVELPSFPAVAPDPSTRKPKTIAVVSAEAESKLKEMKAQRKSRRSKKRRGSGSDSGSGSGSGSSRSRSRSGSESGESEFSSFGSESDASSRSRSRSSRSRSRSRSSSRSSRRSSFSSSSSRSRSRSSSSRSRSSSRSGSDSDSRRKKKKASKKSKRSRSSSASSRSRSTSRDRRRRRSRSRSSSPAASAPKKSGGFSAAHKESWSLDFLGDSGAAQSSSSAVDSFLDLKGLDLSSHALENPNLESSAAGLGEAHIKFSKHESSTSPENDPFSGLADSSSNAELL